MVAAQRQALEKALVENSLLGAQLARASQPHRVGITVYAAKSNFAIAVVAVLLAGHPLSARGRVLR